VSYPSDEPEYFLKERLIDDVPELRWDDRFQALAADLFDIPDNAKESHSYSFDDFAEDYEALEAYLADVYDIGLDDYWDWKEWRDEYNAA
jgi:hypothetical protein